MKPLTLSELRSLCRDMNLTTFRLYDMRETAREFGHSPLVLDRVASEHSATICERMRKARMRVVGNEEKA